MQGLKAAFFNELYKLSKRKKLVVAVILTVVAIAVSGLLSAGANNFAGVMLTGGSFAVTALSVLIYTLIPLFTAFICIDMFSGEFSDNTIKFSLTRPVSRLKVYLSKVLCAAAFIAADLLFVMLVSIAASLIVPGAGLRIGRIVLAYTASFFPLMVFALFVIVLSNLTKSGAGAFMLSVVFFLVFNVLGLVFADIRSFLFTSFFDWYTLFLGSFVNLQKVLRVFLILLGCGTMLFSVGYYLFDKKQI